MNKSLDLMFIMDCTGSMNPWIDAAKKKSNQLLTALEINSKISKSEFQ